MKQWGLLTNYKGKNNAIKSGIHIFETKTVYYSTLVLLELKSVDLSPILDIFLWYNGFKSGILELTNHYVILATIMSSATYTK